MATSNNVYSTTANAQDSVSVLDIQIAGRCTQSGHVGSAEFFHAQAVFQVDGSNNYTLLYYNIVSEFKASDLLLDRVYFTGGSSSAICYVVSENDYSMEYAVNTVWTVAE